MVEHHVPLWTWAFSDALFWLTLAPGKRLLRSFLDARLSPQRMLKRNGLSSGKIHGKTLLFTWTYTVGYSIACSLPLILGVVKCPVSVWLKTWVCKWKLGMFSVKPRCHFFSPLAFIYDVIWYRYQWTKISLLHSSTQRCRLLPSWNNASKLTIALPAANLHLKFGCGFQT